MRGFPSPQPIIFETLKLLQQIIYRRKGNVSESPIHFKYRENILISRFYEQFSRSSRNLGHFLKFAKIAHEVAKSKYFRNILIDWDSLINALSDDI